MWADSPRSYSSGANVIARGASRITWKNEISGSTSTA